MEFGHGQELAQTSRDERATQPHSKSGHCEDAHTNAQIAQVLALVARRRRVPVILLLHPSRCRIDAAEARAMAMYLVHTAIGRSLTDVGAVFGRDRTTVSHACARIEDRRDDPRFDAEMCGFEAAITQLASGHAEGH